MKNYPRRRKRFCEMSERHLRRLASDLWTSDSSEVDERIDRRPTMETRPSVNNDMDDLWKSGSSEVDVRIDRRRPTMETRPSKFRKVVESDIFKKNYIVEMSEESSNEGASNLCPFPQLQNEVQEGCNEEIYGFLNQDRLSENEHEVQEECNKEIDGFLNQQAESEDDYPGESLAKKEMSNRDFQRVVLRKINKLIIEQKRFAEKQTEMMERLLQIQKGEKNLVTDDTRIMLPIKSPEELDALCKLISDANEMNKLVMLLKSCGGSDIKQSCKLSLKKLLVDDLASKYSFQGRRSKPAFHHFLVNEAIRLSIRSRFPDALDSEINKRIEDYLRYAPQRERREMKSVPVVVTDQPLLVVIKEERG